MARRRAPTETRAFLRALFDNAPADDFVLLWQLPGRRSRWFSPPDLDEMADAVIADRDHDAYVGVGLSPEDYGERRRCPAERVSGMVALWADVDFADDVHRKSNLPPTPEAATELVHEVGIEPSIVVHSGHGLQAWWLLDEPWLFADDTERRLGADLASRWQATLRAKANAHGWTLDATQDLSRVMRIPGSRNHKAKPVLDVLTVTATYGTYGRDDFAEYLIDEADWQRLAGRRGYVVGAVTLDPQAWPPGAKMDALLANDTKFRQTWERTRRDMKDDSPSAYDLALASQAAAIGWGDQEIVDLLIASRVKHGDDPKMRLDYYTLTLGTARDDQLRNRAVEELSGLRTTLEQAEVVGKQSEAHHARRGVVNELSTMLGFDVSRFVKLKQDPPKFRMETPTASVTIGTAASILAQHTMRAAIASATGFVIPVYKQQKWHTIAQAIFAACEVEDTGMESTDAGLGYAWLTEYLQDRTVLTDRNQAAEQQWPYVNGDMLFVFGAPLRKWLGMSRNEHVNAQRMGEVLRVFGAQPDTIAVSIRDKRSTRSVWCVGRATDLGVAPTGKVGPIQPGDEPGDDDGPVATVPGPTTTEENS